MNALDIPSGSAREINLVVVGLALVAKNLTICAELISPWRQYISYLANSVFLKNIFLKFIIFNLGGFVVSSLEISENVISKVPHHFISLPEPSR